MPGQISYDLPNGERRVDTYVGLDVADEAIFANEAAMLREGTEGPRVEAAIEATRQSQREAREAELDVKYPYRHEHPVKLFARGLVYSLTHYGRSQ